MDMWQRCIAFSKTKDEDNNPLSDETLISLLRKKTFKNAIIPFLILFIVWFGIGILALGVNLTNDLSGIIPSFLAAFDAYGPIGYFSKAVVIAGFVAAMLSTVDTFLLATVQTIMYDIYGTAVVRGLTNKLDTLDKFQQYRFVNISKILIILLGIAAVIIAFFSFGLMNFWTTMYSIMLSFFPAVYESISGRSQNYRFNSVFYSIVIGSFGALILGVLGTFILNNPYVVGTAPLFAVLSSTIIMKIFR